MPSRSKISMKRSDVQTILSRLNGMATRNGGRGFINWLLRVPVVIRGGNTAALARSAVVCMRVFTRILQKQGVRGLVLYTKSCYVLLMQAKGGHKLHNPGLLGPGIKRDRSGFPLVIPVVHRTLIRQGDVAILRVWLSWFSIYRILEFPSKLKLQTITDPGVNIDRLLIESAGAITSFCELVLNLKRGKTRLPVPVFVPLSKSTPSIDKGKDKISWSPEGIFRGGCSLMASEVYPHFTHLLTFFTGYTGSKFAKAWENMVKAAPQLESSFHRPPVGRIGKLGFKREAAGKVRVFAMVECWTQWILKPLHDFLFSLLSAMPSDGTFDQFAPVDRLIEGGYTRFWCYDLSAATDRLPVALQAHILDWIFGSCFGCAWRGLLVNRDYHLPLKVSKGILVDGELPVKVRYQVGQPMGALSSWPMLALTHHFIVHWAAFRVGYTWGSFWAYAVLGDDIIVADGKVAGAYLQLMEALGVGIGLAKSLVSRKGVLEFAKRFYVQGQNCSPVPFKEMVAAVVDFETSTEFIRKYELGARSIAAFLGFGYRVRGRLSATFDRINSKLATVGIWRVSPWGVAPHNFSSWLNINSWVIRPNWLTQTTEMWPELPVDVSDSWRAWALLDAPRLEKIRASLPTRYVFSGCKSTVKWMEDGLWQLAKSTCSDKILTLFSAKFYNTLHSIQEEYWSRSIPLLKSDLRKYADVVAGFKLSSAGRPLPEWRVLDWVKIRTDTTLLQGPVRLGTKTTIKSTPSILFPTRLWRKVRGGRAGK